MGACVYCGTSSLFLRTSKDGLCTDCEGAVRSRFEAEKERLKEAVIVLRALKDPRDQVLQLRRALDSVRVLTRYERLGCGPVKPDLRTVETTLSARLKTALALRHAGSPARVTAAATEEPRPEGERRRARRKAEALPVRLGKGIRALTGDTSSRGVRLHSPVFQAPGTRLALVLHLHQGPVSAKAVVRWVQPLGEEGRREGPAVMGLEFDTPLMGLASSG